MSFPVPKDFDRPGYFKATFSCLIWPLKVYSWMIILRIVFSWLQPSRQYSFVRLWFDFTDPGFEILHILVPPLTVSGWYFPDLSILLLLMSLYAAEIIFSLIGPSGES